VLEQTGLALAALSAEQRGCLLGASLLCLGERALARLAADGHETWRTAWQTLRALPRPERAGVLAGWLLELQSPFPAGMDRLHPSWIAEAVACEPEDLWPALLSGVPGAEAVTAFLPGDADQKGKAGQAWPPESVVELQRCVFVRLAPLGVAPSGPVGAGLCRLGCAELLVEVMRRGAGEQGIRSDAPSDRDEMCAQGLAALCQELRSEGDASLWAVAGRLPAQLGKAWVNLLGV
jgi:hypothetical protein